MHRIGFLIIAEEMLRRSGARDIEVRYWSDTERGSMRIEKRDKRKKKGKRSSDLGKEL